MTFIELLQLLWRRKWIALSVLVLTVAASVAYAFLKTPVYKVTMKLLPQQEDDATAAGLTSVLGQFGGLTSLIGIGAMSSINEQEAYAWLRSRRLADEFIRKYNLMPVLFHEQWDEANNRWRADLPPEDVPTMDDAWEMFDQRVRRVSRDAKTKIVTLEIRWKDRELAARWADLLVQEANQALRARSLRMADASLEFLERQLKETSVVELEQAIYRLMETQITKKVVANARPDFAFTIIDPAVVPDADRFDSPRRLLIVAAGFVAGGLLALLAVLAIEFTPAIVHKMLQSPS